MPLSYDRRAPDQMMDALLPGGFAHSLVEYGRAGRFALDLQLRGYANKPGHWATLYVGLTKVLDLHFRPRAGFKLAAHPAYTGHPDYGWNPGWNNSQSAANLAAEWPEVDEYIERAVTAVAKVARFHVEGSVQSAISGFNSRDIVVIDREAVISFGGTPGRNNDAEKKRVTGALQRPLLEAVRESNGAKWWKPDDHLGDECDAVGLTTGGQLAVIEVKPSKETGKIRWAPLQVRQYAKLFDQWASQDPNQAAEILLGMLEQRRRLGLAPANFAPEIKTPIEVVPIVAIGRGYSQAAIDGMREVHRRLDKKGLNSPPLRAFEVTSIGRLHPEIELQCEAG
jgi:hypothetical protein